MEIQNNYPKFKRRWMKIQKSSKVLEFQKRVVTNTLFVCVYAVDKKLRISSQVLQRGSPCWTFRIWQNSGSCQDWYKATVPVSRMAKICPRAGGPEEEEGQTMAGKELQVLHFCPSYSRLRTGETNASYRAGNEARG